VNLRRRTLAQLVSALLVAAAVPPSARASIFGEENATLIAILAEEIEAVLQAYRTVEGIVQQISKLETMIGQGKTMLRQLDNPQGFYNLLVFAQQATRTLQTLDANIKHLGYRFEQISGQHRAVFPTQQSLAAMPSGDFRQRAQTWNDALRESSEVAMRVQTSVRTLEDRGRTLEHILQASGSAEGVVGQLQAVVNGLALLHSDLVAIEENLAAGQRVTATWAGVHASERELGRERRKRMMQGYTNPGATPRMLKELL